VEAALIARPVDWVQQTSDLGRQEILAAIESPQCIAQPPLAEAKPVVGSGVEVTDAALPAGDYALSGDLIFDRSIEVPERRRSEPVRSDVAETLENGSGVLSARQRSL
jgi:hypothetical protein